MSTYSHSSFILSYLLLILYNIYRIESSYQGVRDYSCFGHITPQYVGEKCGRNRKLLDNKCCEYIENFIDTFALSYSNHFVKLLVGIELAAKSTHFIVFYGLIGLLFINHIIIFRFFSLIMVLRWLM